MNGLRFLLGDTANPDKIVSKWNMLEEKATYLVNNLFGIEINNDIKSIVLEINKKFHKEKELNIDNYKKTEENELIIDFGAIEQDRELSHLICLSIAAGLPGQLFEIAAEHSGEIIRESENIDKITFIGNSAAGAIAQYAYVSTGTGPGKQCVTLNSVGIKRFTEFNGNEFFGYPLAFDYFLSDLFRIDNNMRYLLVELEKYGVLEDGNISYRFRKDYGKKIDRERILFVLVNILMSKSDAEKEEIQELVENLFDPLIVERKMLFIDRYRDYIVKRDKDTIINYVMSDNIPALMYGHIGGTYIVDKDMNKYNPGLTDEVLGKIERLDQDKLELLTESNSEIFQPFILRKEKGNGDRTVNRFGQTPEINQMTNNLSLDYLSALIKDIIRDLHNKDNNILKCLFKSSRLDHGSEFIEIIKDRLRHSMLLQGKIPGSDDIYKSSYFKENPGLLTEQDKVYSLAGPAVRQLERMSDHDIRKLFKWELTGEGIFLIICGKEESEDENSGKQDDSIIEYHGSDSKQKFDNSEERLKLECNEPSRNRIYGSSRQGRYIEELDNEYLLKDEDAYQFNNSQGAGFEILSENTSPERKIKIDGRDISIEY
ncbi:MAG: hypothetical protein GX175_03775, partial [Halanaerobiaceae bacterium]|nr:hypothetical protein [Halanaerobiaceae bacterium]